MSMVYVRFLDGATVYLGVEANHISDAPGHKAMAWQVQSENREPDSALTILK